MRSKSSGSYVLCRGVLGLPLLVEITEYAWQMRVAGVPGAGRRAAAPAAAGRRSAGTPAGGHLADLHSQTINQSSQQHNKKKSINQ